MRITCRIFHILQTHLSNISNYPYIQFIKYTYPRAWICIFACARMRTCMVLKHNTNYISIFNYHQLYFKLRLSCFVIFFTSVQLSVNVCTVITWSQARENGPFALRGRRRGGVSLSRRRRPWRILAFIDRRAQLRRRDSAGSLGRRRLLLGGQGRRRQDVHPTRRSLERVSLVRRVVDGCFGSGESPSCP